MKFYLAGMVCSTKKAVANLPRLNVYEKILLGFDF